MRKFYRWISTTIFLLAVFGIVSADAQVAAPKDFRFSSFVGNYYIDRDAKGLAVLTVQEDMLVQFPPGSNLYGINRVIPENYQGHSVNLKLVSVSDGSGQSLKYRTYKDQSGNLVISLGDPAIIINGPQTYRIKYSTNDVAAFYGNKDEFLVDINGRGWKEGFDQVIGYVHIAKSFAGYIAGKPSCYTGFSDQQNANCKLSTSKTAQETLVSASTSDLAANQTLALKLDFKKGTFQSHRQSNKWLYVLGIVAGLALIVFGFRIMNRVKSRA